MNKKRLIKIGIAIILIAIIFFVYKYLQPNISIKNEAFEKNIPVKINLYRSERLIPDSIIVYLPYKFKVNNNRPQKIAIGGMYFSQIVAGTDVLLFDEDGNSLGAENPKNIRMVLPFRSKSFYYYKPFRLSLSVLEKEISPEELNALYKSFNTIQSTNLLAKTDFKVRQKTVDSIYDADKNQPLLFTFKDPANNDYGDYRIKYDLSNDAQKFYDYYDKLKKMSKEELLDFMMKPIYEE